jgi:hypothetical protein
VRERLLDWRSGVGQVRPSQVAEPREVAGLAVGGFAVMGAILPIRPPAMKPAPTAWTRRSTSATGPA